MDVVSVEDKVLSELLDLGVASGSLDLLKNAFNYAFTHNSRHFFDFFDSKGSVGVAHKRTARLEGIDTSSKIALRNLDQGVQNLLTFNLNTFLLTNKPQSIFLGSFSDS